ncbi:MAG: 2-keto-4-pentenoate hydratase/2-oxohepta-3-ene-1,7-dioic acid hydratase in catechol pathway [Cellvibrionaceae bacterium]|jgi:2-keto-4-pentenoate hydratase/2-oxohepta-3-ene-1,7-dioic acid hydratase in catechol pathway
MHKVIFGNTQTAPSKIVCIGRNYVDHAKELGHPVPSEPVIFIKPNSSISNILLAASKEANHYEGEICFLVQKSQLTAVGFGLDLTKRLTQTRLKEARLPWERAKSFDGAAVFSEFVAVEQGQINSLRLELYINGECRQAGGVDLMLFKPLVILDEITRFLSLEDGDIIMTGTPKGVGEVVFGANFTGKILINDKVLIEASWIAE